jgi:ADP-heptose:LPS heptosyltransferase
MEIQVKKFLIIQTAFLGDVILATPLVSELAQKYPSAQIDFLVRKGNESLIVSNPHIHEVLLFDKKQGKIKSMFALIQKIRLTAYDEVINLHRFASSGFITAFSGAKLKVGFDKNPFSICYQVKVKHQLDGEHEVTRNLKLIQRHTTVTLSRPTLFPSEKDFQKVAEFQTETYYCLAPASVWFTKQLPVEHWVKLGQFLATKGNVYLVGGPDDFALCEQIKEEIQASNCYNQAGSFSLLQSAVLFHGAKRTYVNDSGPLHLCSAMNAAVTVFYCSTVPAFGFGPLSEDAEIKESLEALACRPCGIHGFKKCPKNDFQCGLSIPLNVAY